MKIKDYKNMICELLDIDIGVYPKQIIGGGNHSYKRRTKFMDGWNAAIKEYALEELRIFKKYKNIKSSALKTIKEFRKENSG